MALVNSEVNNLIQANMSTNDIRMIVKICLRFFNFLIYFHYTLIFLNMQKLSLSQIIRQELTRALIFGVGFFIILSFGFVSIGYAANGWIFGDILNKILASGNWESPGDGTVKNAERLWNRLPTEFVTAKAWQTCGGGKCIQWFQPDGTVICEP